jgi:hypothetical protein
MMAGKWKRVRVLLAGVVIVMLSAIGGCTTSCPTALLPGVLVANGPALAIRQDGANIVLPIDWPSGYRVRAESGRLVLTDPADNVIATAGDHVQLPGGETRSGGPWGVCGEVVVDPS